MDTPLFLDIEASSAEPDAFPVAIAWSNHAGDIHHRLIAPMDDWTQVNTSLHSHLSIEELLMRGESPWEVIKSLNSDLADEVVYVDGLDEDERWLHKLFDAFNTDLSFSVRPFMELLPQTSHEDLHEQRRDIFHEFGLDLEYPESHVRALQILYQRITLMGDF